MRRSVETAQIIAEACGLPLQECPALHERRMGSMSGMGRAEGWPIYEETKELWKQGRLDFTHEGGESFLDMQERAIPAFRSLIDHAAGTSIVVVAHGVINRVLVSSMVEGFTPADFDRIGIDFVGVHDLRWDGTTLRLAEYWPGDPTPPLRLNPSHP
jgi:probable phosphoglycerate mutase